MAALGNLVSSQFGARLQERGFEKHAGRRAVTVYARPATEDQHIAFDRVRGEDVRLFLSVGRTYGVTGDEPIGIEAESPWFSTFERPLETALDEAWTFLEECGFRWLEDPMALTPTQWRVQHNLLVRDYRLAHVSLTWPAEQSLNDRVLRLRRCVPSFTGMPALEVRTLLQSASSLDLGEMPLADAHELRVNAEAEGFAVEVRRI